MGCTPTKSTNTLPELVPEPRLDGDAKGGDGQFLGVTPIMARRMSRSVMRLEDISKARQEGDGDDPEADPVMKEIFEFSDFAVNVGAPPSPLKAPSPNPMSARARRRMSAQFGRAPPSARRRNSLKDGTFVFGDFCVSMENDLEESIMKAHYEQSTGDTSRETNKNKSPPVAPRGKLIPASPQRGDHHAIRNFSMYTLLGHATRVKCIALTPTEQYYVSCSHEDMSVSMHDVRTGREIVAFFGHEDTIIGASFSYDSKLLATTSRDNSMILWDAVTGKQLFIFDHEKVVICCAFSHDSRYLVSGCQDMVCRVWDTRKRRELLAFTEHEGIIVSVAWSLADDLVVSAAADKTVKLWSSRNGDCVRTLRGHTGIVLSCSFSGDGEHIVSNDEQYLKVWEAKTGQCITTLGVDAVPRPKMSNVKVAKRLAWTLSCYCPGLYGFYVIAVSNDRMVHILHPLSGTELLSFYCKAPVYCLTSGETSKIAFGDSFGNIYVVVLE